MHSYLLQAAAKKGSTMLGNIAGGDGLIVLLIGIFYAVPLWAIIDAAIRPRAAWQAIGRSKTIWLVLLIVFLIFFAPVSLVLAIIYLASIRGKLRVQAGQLQNTGWRPPPIGSGAPPGWYPNTQDPRFVLYWDGTRYTDQRPVPPPPPPAP
jgi:hypothetical protein